MLYSIAPSNFPVTKTVVRFIGLSYICEEDELDADGWNYSDTSANEDNSFRNHIR